MVEKSKLKEMFTYWDFETYVPLWETIYGNVYQTTTAPLTPFLYRWKGDKTREALEVGFKSAKVANCYAKAFTPLADEVLTEWLSRSRSD